MSLSFNFSVDTTDALINITIAGLLATEDTLLVVRNNPDGSITNCRQANNVTVGPGGSPEFAFADFEAPLNVPVTYSATSTQHNSDGTVTQQTGDSAPVTLTFLDQMIWLKSLAQTALSMPIEIASMDAVVRPARQTVNNIIGARFPVVLSDVQGARAGSMLLTTYTLAERSNLLALLNLGQVILMQCDQDPVAGDGFEDMYFMVGDINEQRPAVISVFPVRQWQLTFTEVDVPSGVITALPGNSWLQVATGFTSWAALLDPANGRTSWLDVLNRPAGS